ncbi:MAG: hypothetical protein LBM19_00625 [Holosporales bacterium]|jgi:hypothetical protein|nr:hypothetical protein [Holosporales bacterium]
MNKITVGIAGVLALVIVNEAAATMEEKYPLEKRKTLRRKWETAKTPSESIKLIMSFLQRYICSEKETEAAALALKNIVEANPELIKCVVESSPLMKYIGQGMGVRNHVVNLLSNIRCAERQVLNGCIWRPRDGMNIFSNKLSSPGGRGEASLETESIDVPGGKEYVYRYRLCDGKTFDVRCRDEGMGKSIEYCTFHLLNDKTCNMLWCLCSIKFHLREVRHYLDNRNEVDLSEYLKKERELELELSTIDSVFSILMSLLDDEDKRLDAAYKLLEIKGQLEIGRLCSNVPPEEIVTKVRSILLALPDDDDKRLDVACKLLEIEGQYPNVLPEEIVTKVSSILSGLLVGDECLDVIFRLLEIEGRYYGTLPEEIVAEVDSTFSRLLNDEETALGAALSLPEAGLKVLSEENRRKVAEITSEPES